MTEQFDKFCESLIYELTTTQSKRRESRYWADTMFPKSGIRKISAMKDKTPSQRSKLGNQQYIGNYWSADGVRGKNKSEKDLALAAIAKGLGTHIKIKGTNPKKPGARVNSKQGNMEVKYTLGNGLSKVGATGKTDFQFSKPKHYK